MDNTAVQRIRESITKNQQIGIVVGKNANLDDMAAALSIYLVLKTSDKNVSIACPTDPLVEVSSLVGIDKVKNSLDGEGGDLVVSFPYRDREIEKVSYTLEEGFLNIVVKAGTDGLSFTEKEVKYKRGGSLPTLLFVVGTPRLSDLGSLFNPDALKNTTVINIDNKIDNQGFGDIVVVSPRSSSVSEEVANILTSLEFPFDIDLAQNLLSGINFATDNFQDPKTSVAAFEMAAFLMKKGAVRSKAVKQKQNVSQDNGFFGAPQSQSQPQPQIQQAQPDSFMPRKNDQRDQFNPLPKPNNPRPQQPRDNNRINDFMQRNNQQPRPQQPQPNQQPAQSGFAQPQQQQQPQVQPQKQNAQAIEHKDDDDTPPDWLTPKVYKSSTLV